MKFHFWSNLGEYLFQRTDAEEFKHYCEDFACEGVFPFDALHKPEPGMLIGWQDGDEWQVHEISATETDGFGDSIRIMGAHIVITMLRKTIIKEAKLKNRLPTVLLSKILPGTGIYRRTVDSLPDEDRARISAYSQLREEPSTTAASLGNYGAGNLVTVLEYYNDTFWLVATADGKIGYILSANIKLLDDTDATFSSGGGSKRPADDITPENQVKTGNIDQTYITAWDALTEFLEPTCFYIHPDIEIIGHDIGRLFIDLLIEGTRTSNMRLTCDWNLQQVGITYDTSNILTRAIGIGKNDINFSAVVWKFDETKADTPPVDKPSGQIWVSSNDPEVTERWKLLGGRPRTGVLHFDDISDTAELLSTTYQTLGREHSLPDITIDCKAADLYALGYGGEPMRHHDMVYLILRPIGQRIKAHIQGLTKDLIQPERTQPVIGTLNRKDLLREIKATRR